MAQGSPPRNARGRPALPLEKGKRFPLGIRTTKELKSLLQNAADSSGRSVAQEIEFRLERSFDRDRTLADALGGGRAAAFFLHLAAKASVWGQGESWLDNYSLFNAVRAQFEVILERATPHVPDKIREEIDAWDLVIEAAMRDEFPAELRDRVIVALRMATGGKPPTVRRKFASAAEELATKFAPAPSKKE